MNFRYFYINGAPVSTAGSDDFPPAVYKPEKLWDKIK
jgi:hypothetical protein